MSPSSPEEFTGYAALNQKDGQKLDVKKWSYKPTEWQETMVDIKITHCRSVPFSALRSVLELV